jgi:hypothetical protein
MISRDMLGSVRVASGGATLPTLFLELDVKKPWGNLEAV